MKILARAVVPSDGTPEPVLSRVHSACVTSEIWAERDCDCAEQLDVALATISSRYLDVWAELLVQFATDHFTD